MAKIFKLIIEDDEGKTTVYPLSDGEVSIGRKEGNTIRLMERNVSRRHARLARQNGTVFIEDLDSYNGIRINGERINGRYEVKEGDLVEIGDYHLALQESMMQEPAPPPPEPQQPAAPANEQRPVLPGTVPDFELPKDILPDNEKSARDTIVDEPVPNAPPVPSIGLPESSPPPEPVPPPADPLVNPPKPPAQHGMGDLPPFPGPSASPFQAPALDAQKATIESKVVPVAGKRPPPAVTSPVPRLVCVSTSYAGQEFALTRPELIIGRVEDNDIVIEHRSVSRNHSKILFDGKTHKIIDLQSANGILVNGEEYAMTDLRKGDLIELGHVRFRFVPANESFYPIDEEKQQMREAGVDLAEAQKPEEVPAFDPSTAATVTDTPLSALNMDQVLAPKVEQPPERPRAVEPPPPKPPKPEPRRKEEERPPELSRPSPGNGAGLGAAAAPAEPVTRQASVEDIAPRPPPPKSKLPLVLVVVLVVALIAVVALVMRGPDGKADAQIKSLFQKGQHSEVVKYFEGHADEFANPKEAAKLYKQSLRAQDEPDKAPNIPDPPEEDLPPGDATKETPPPRVDTTPVPPTKRPTKVRKRGPKKKLKRAKDLADQGKKALLRGDLSKAESNLERCLVLAPLPECHRTLGILYAQRDETGKAIKHYKQYLNLAPNAPDANRVRHMIREAESGGQ